jgi:hypothetical protein
VILAVEKVGDCERSKSMDLVYGAASALVVVGGAGDVAFAAGCCEQEIWKNEVKAMKATT